MRAEKFVVVALCAATLGAVADEPHVTLADKPAPAMTAPDSWWQKAATYRDDEAFAKRDADVVFMGDSIIHYFEWKQNQPTWNKWFGDGAPYRGLNFAIEGDTTDNLLWRMRKSLDKVVPKAIVLLIGTNNAGKRNVKTEPPEDTVRGLKAIIDDLRKHQPQAKVLVYALFPRGKGVTDPCMIRNEKVNEGLRQLCDGRQFVFRDIRAKFLNADGTVNEKYLFDRLHPSTAGYELWLADIVPELEKIFADFAADRGRQVIYWGRYALRAYQTFRPGEMRRAIAELEKIGFEPGELHVNCIYPTIKMFGEYETFPRAEADIRFPASLADLGVADTKSVEAADFGWNARNATACLQAAIDSGATTVHVRPQDGPWYIDSIRVRSNQRIVFHRGVKVLMDKSSPKRDQDYLFRVEKCENVILEGEGTGLDDSYLGGYANYAERRQFCRDYGKSVVCLMNSRNVLIRNLRLAESAEDGIFFGGHGMPNRATWVDDVVIDSHFRQAMSICNADGVYCRKVQFLNTRGNAPSAGIDFEPPLECEPDANVYLFDCTFENNNGGALMFATSTYAPICVHAKRTHFRRHRAPLVEMMPRPGAYLGPRCKAPTKIILEDCDFETYCDEPAVNIRNALLFDFTLRNCVIRSTPQKGDALRKYVAAPIRLSFHKDLGIPAVPPHMLGVGTFDNVRCEGYPAGTPPVDVVDAHGSLSVSNALAGAIELNGQKIDLAAFAYAPDPEDTARSPLVFDAAERDRIRYFEVPAGGKPCRVRMSEGSLELRDPGSNVVERVREGEYLGRHVFTVTPSTERAEIWSFRQPARSGRAVLRFCDPLTNVVSDMAETLPCRFRDHFVPERRTAVKPDLSWGDPIDLTVDVTRPLVDRTRLAAADATALDAAIAARQEFAARREWSRQLEKETALLTRMKATAKTDGERHDIEMESLNLPALERNAEVERTAAAEGAFVRELAAFCGAFMGRLAPQDDPSALRGALLAFGLSLAPKSGELEYDDVRKLVLLRDAILAAGK